MVDAQNPTGQVADQAALDTIQNPAQGDVYITLDTGDAWQWTGTVWADVAAAPVGAPICTLNGSFTTKCFARTAGPCLSPGTAVVTAALAPSCAWKGSFDGSFAMARSSLRTSSGVGKPLVAGVVAGAGAATGAGAGDGVLPLDISFGTS